MLFLGAGASNAFGVGDLTDWTGKVNDKLNKKGYSHVTRHIVETLSNANEKMDARSRFFVDDEEIDLEVIMSVMDFLLEPNTTLRQLGPVAIYLNELRSLSENADFTQLTKREILTIRNTIENTIVQSCDNYDFETAKAYYHNLFFVFK